MSRSGNTKVTELNPDLALWSGAVEAVHQQQPRKNAYQRALDDIDEQQSFDADSSITEPDPSGIRKFLSSYANVKLPANRKQSPLERKMAQLSTLKAAFSGLQTQLREAERYGSTEDGKTCSEIEVEIDDTQANISQLTADIDRLKRIIDEKHTGRPAFKTEVEKFDFGLDESVKVWSDFSGVAYHPRSINLLKNTTHDDTFDIYSQGELSSLEMEEYFDNLRLFAEECDRLKGFHCMVDGATAFGCFAERFLTEVQEEFPKSTRITFCDVSIPQRPKSVMVDDYTAQQRIEEAINRSIINSGLSIAKLKELSTAIAPYSVSHLTAGRFPQLLYQSGKPFHSSSLIASAIDNLSLFYRFSDDGYTIDRFASNMALLPSLNVNALALAYPFPIVEQKTKLRDVLTKNNTINVAPWMTQLLPHINRQKHITPFSEVAILRGVPEWANEYPIEETRMHHEQVPVIKTMSQWITNLECSKRTYMACREASPAPVAFPRYFNRHINRNGYYDPLTENKTHLVRSLPTLSHAQASGQMQPYFRKMKEYTGELDISRLAANGVAKDEVDEVQNNWAQLSEDYEFHGAV